MDLKIGDWIRSYSAGIWQVYKILEYKCINPINGETQKKMTVFSKRFVSNTFKRSFKQEGCDPSLVRKLDKAEQKELDNFISGNADLYKNFNELELDNIDCIYNARIEIPEDKSIENVASKFELTEYIKDTDIKSHLTKLGFNTNAMPSWTVQFVSPNYHCIDGHLAFKFNRVLEF